MSDATDNRIYREKKEQLSSKTSNQGVNKQWLCSIGLHFWEGLADVFAFARSWKHAKCVRCGKEKYV